MKTLCWILYGVVCGWIIAHTVEGIPILGVILMVGTWALIGGLVGLTDTLPRVEPPGENIVEEDEEE